MKRRNLSTNTFTITVAISIFFFLKEEGTKYIFHPKFLFQGDIVDDMKNCRNKKLSGFSFSLHTAVSRYDIIHDTVN